MTETTGVMFNALFALLAFLGAIFMVTVLAIFKMLHERPRDDDYGTLVIEDEPDESHRWN